MDVRLLGDRLGAHKDRRRGSRGDDPLRTRRSNLLHSASGSVVALLLSLAACGLDNPASSDQPSPTFGDGAAPESASALPDVPGSTPDALQTPPDIADGLPLSCGSPLTFNAAALLGPAGAETADHPVAIALRELISNSPLPSRPGWRIVVLNATHALFLLPALADEGSAFWNAEFEHRGSWVYVRSGQCDVRPNFGVLEPAHWELSGDQILRPDSRSLDISVTELGCASGESPDGRVVPAAVVYLETSVTIFIATRPLPGPQTCVPGPPARVALQLSEPIGDRQLFDGSVVPPEARGAARPAP
jgi:hypothetical protein